MTVSSLAQEILAHLDELSPHQQQEILELVRSFLRPRGRPGSDVLALAGTIDAADLTIMQQVADQECEGIDPDGW